MASQFMFMFMFKRPTTASTGMVPPSEDEPKGSGRGGLWKPFRSEYPSTSSYQKKKLSAVYMRMQKHENGVPEAPSGHPFDVQGDLMTVN